jgi:two-component sensor histidine kinase
MVGELQHRTRNLIALVMAMADRTEAPGQSLEGFKAAFRQRLMALSRVQGLLSRAAPGEGVSLTNILESELSAQSALGNKKITLEGPKDVVVRFGSVQAMAMALHELTTNAVKYGALAHGDGRLLIRWRVETENGAPWLNLEWKESGVDMAQSPDKGRESGSGRRLIEEALPYQFGARTTFAIEADGVRCTIALPLSKPHSEEVEDGQPDAS